MSRSLVNLVVDLINYSKAMSRTKKIVFGVVAGLIVTVGLIVGITLLVISKSAARSPGCQCESPIPGISSMSQGVDFATFDLNPLTNEYEGLRSVLFYITCPCNKSQNRIFETDSSSGRHYHIPREFTRPSFFPAKETSLQTKVCSSAEDYQSSSAVSASVGAQFRGLGVSLSSRFQHAVTSFSERREKTVLAQKQLELFIIELQAPSDLTLSPKFLNDLTKLPPLYEDGPDKYQAFLKKYGTHYINQAKFGGQLLQISTLTSKYSSKADQTKIEVGVEASFKAFSGSVKLEATEESDEKTFSESSSTEFRYFGGYHLGKFNNSNWRTSIADNPHMIATRLTSIDHLIVDVNLKSQMIKAIRLVNGPKYLEMCDTVAKAVLMKIDGYTGNKYNEKCKDGFEMALMDIEKSKYANTRNNYKRNMLFWSSAGYSLRLCALSAPSFSRFIPFWPPYQTLTELHQTIQQKSGDKKFLLSSKVEETCRAVMKAEKMVNGINDEVLTWNLIQFAFSQVKK